MVAIAIVCMFLASGPVLQHIEMKTRFRDPTNICKAPTITQHVREYGFPPKKTLRTPIRMHNASIK